MNKNSSFAHSISKMGVLVSAADLSAAMAARSSTCQAASATASPSPVSSPNSKWGLAASVTASVAHPRNKSRRGHSLPEGREVMSSASGGRMRGRTAHATSPPSTALGRSASSGAPKGRKASTAAPVMAWARWEVAPAARPRDDLKGKEGGDET